MAYKKRTAMRRTVKRRTRRTIIPRTMINSNMLFINCELSLPIEIPISTMVSRFNYIGPGPLSFIDMGQFLTNSNTFNEMATRFALYKITALKIDVRPTFFPHLNTNLEYPCFGINFFPSTTGSFIGSSSVINSDKSMIVSSNQSYVSKKWSFPNNYYEGNGTGGYGVWNTTTNYANLPGSIQLGSYSLLSNFSATTRIANCRAILYIVFKDKQLTA